MTLDRGRLAKIDQQVFAELDHTDGVQMVKVPVSDALWSTWRRYCEAMGMSMGASIARLMVDELETVVGGDGTTAAQLGDQIAQMAAERSSQLDRSETGPGGASCGAAEEGGASEDLGADVEDTRSG